MLLNERLHSFFGKLISWLLIITTQGMTAHIAYSQDEFSKVVQEANEFAKQLSSKRATPSIDANGNLSSGGNVIFSSEELTGQTEDDYLPANTDTYGDDAATLIQGQAAQSQYESMGYDDASTSGERAYHIINKSFSTQKPDLTNDPMWNETDNVLENIEEIAKDFAECRVSKELVNTGETIHVPVYKTCDRLPALEETFHIGHDYEVGVIKHKSGPMNLQSCGDGCLRVWIGTVGNDYWSGWCTIYEEKMSVEVIQPDKIIHAKLERSKFDDYHQVYVNGTKIYNGPNGNFPPETGGSCELSTSWDKYPNINITNYFNIVPHGGELEFKTRTSASGNGEGYSALLIQYDPNALIYNDVWTDDERIEKAHQIKTQLDDGFCEGHITCTNSPTLDANGCATINGIYVCEDDFQDNPVAELGISPFCKTIEVESNCNFNEGELCWEDMDGNETCFDNDTVNRNTCEQYEQDPTCSYVKTECVEGAEGVSGDCYVQEDTFDCGFTVDNGTTAEEDVVICDGELQCVGESCYSPNRDLANGDFGEVNAYLEMLKWAKNDMACEGVPDAPYDPVAPPDQYTPIETCEEGFEYYPETKQCLRVITCDYSDDDFYAASHREGIQLVKNSAVIAQNSSVPICVPVSKDNHTYTCGDAMKKLATDTYYEICTNEESKVIEKGCPDDDHHLNPETGFCEIPPIVKCEDGYNLIEGLEPFSIDDDICQSKTYPLERECDDGYNYDTVHDQCEKSEKTTPVYTCPSDYALENGVCVQHTYTCKYSRDERNPYYAADTRANSFVKWGRNVVYPLPNDLGYVRGNERERTSQIVYWEACAATSDSVNPIIECPNDFSLVNGECEKKTIKDANESCPTGFQPNKDQTYCSKIPETLPVEPSCPPSYPTWNPSEGRCMTDKSPVPSIPDAPVSSITSFSLTSDPIEQSEQKDDEPTTRASMLSYIDSKVATMVADAIENKEAYEIGQKMLFGSVSAQTLNVLSEQPSPVIQSYGATHAGGSVTGEQNVTCEIFQGTASECKIAIGGMQDCCESPTTVSLGDYITLTTTIMKMDGMTAQLELIEGYNGAWSYVEQGADAAWDAVSSLWSSAADTATQEAASAGMMEGFQQSLMTYTNDFLVEAFGEEVAAMFFQELGTDAAGNAILGASPQMAAVGNALMYCYYAYLAYVVFNLLVGIIYACEEEELDLAMKVELLSTHYIGSYCKDDVLGVCLEKRKVYCSFDSPLSRIIMEEVYKQPQMGLSWGTTSTPNCQGIELDEIDKIDWDLVNLDEWTAILLETGNLPTQQDINIESLTGEGSMLNVDENEPRDNALEVTEDRFEDVDVDQTKRDAYEDGWNKHQ